MAYSIFSAVLGMLQFGYNTGVINAPEQVRRERGKDIYSYLAIKPAINLTDKKTRFPIWSPSNSLKS